MVLNATQNAAIREDSSEENHRRRFARAASAYGTILGLLAAVAVGVGISAGYYPDANLSLALSLVVALVLIAGGERFLIALPFGWGTASISVGAICCLGVAIWLGPVYATILAFSVKFIVTQREWHSISLSIENAGSAALSSAVCGLLWWYLIPDLANPLTDVRTTLVFLLVAVLYTVINFGTVVIGTALARGESVLLLARTMSGGRNFLFTIPLLAAFIPLIGSQSPLALLFFALPLMSSHLALKALWQLQHDTQTTLAALTDILELRDPYTAFHSERVSIYAMAIAESVPMFTPHDRETLERAARIHDIGKAAVRDAILLKAGPLTDDERRSIESHSSIGADLIARMHAYRECVELIRHHHERWDGGGYPSRLIGDRIPLGARIMAVADSLDAMTTDRPYRKAMSFQVAIDEIRRNSRTQFDPDVVEAFLGVLDHEAFDNLRIQLENSAAAD